MKIKGDNRNKNKGRFKALYILFGSVLILVNVLFTFYEIEYWISGVVHLTLILLFLASIRYELIRSVNYIEKLIELMIDEKEISEHEIVYHDDLLSKLMNKIRKANNVYINNKDKMENEKNKIESLISDIAHQIKTPMTNIKMYHEMLTEQLSNNQDEWEMAILVQSQIDKLEFLVQSMLKISELESGMIVLKCVNTRIQVCIVNALENIVLRAEKKKIIINVHKGMDIKVYCDIKWTSEAIFNILDNAVKYTGERGTIDISAEEMQVYTRICIKDNGIGIKRENLTTIFKRFYREDNVGFNEGVGIGLNLSREIIMKQEGYIAVESEKNIGSSFYIFLPSSNYQLIKET